MRGNGSDAVYELDADYLSDDACAEYDLREIQAYLRQVESDNYSAAIERASREIAHDNYRLERLIALVNATVGIPRGKPID